MPDKKHNDDSGDSGAVVRRRLIGAAAMLLFAFVLWNLGEGSPPAQVRIPSPPAEEWQTPQSEILHDAQTRLSESEAVLDAIGGDDDNDGSVFADDEYADATLTADVFNSDDVKVEVVNGAVINDNVDTENNNADESNETAGDDAPPTVAIAKPQPAPDTSGKSFSANVFAIAKNADNFAAQIQAAGLQTETQTYQNAEGKTLHRVMVVNLPDDNAVAAAKTLAQQLEQQPAQTPPQKPSLFVVQIGAFTNPAKARDMAKKLEGEGYAMRISKTSRNGVLLHRVRAAGYQTRAAADESRRNLRALGYVDAQVIDLR